MAKPFFNPTPWGSEKAHAQSMLSISGGLVLQNPSAHLRVMSQRKSDESTKHPFACFFSKPLLQEINSANLADLGIRRSFGGTIIQRNYGGHRHYCGGCGISARGRSVVEVSKSGSSADAGRRSGYVGPDTSPGEWQAGPVGSLDDCRPGLRWRGRSRQRRPAYPACPAFTEVSGAGTNDVAARYQHGRRPARRFTVPTVARGLG